MPVLADGSFFGLSAEAIIGIIVVVVVVLVVAGWIGRRR